MKRIFFLFAIYCVIAMSYATDVSGEQSGTWTPTGNPYHVIGNITVSNTLTISPGVQIFVQGDYSIDVTGNLQAVGTETDSILVTTTSGTWQGITLSNNTEQSQIKYCRIENTEGLNADGVASHNGLLDLEHCVLQHHDKAISIIALGEENPAEVNVTNCLIRACQENGIMITENSNATISNCEITECGLGTQYRGAIQVSVQTTDAHNDPTICNNHIYGNAKQGIILTDVYGTGYIDPLIQNNCIENNLTGIYCYFAQGRIYENTIRNNFIVGDSNSGSGVMCYGSRANPVLAGNEISGNYCAAYIVSGATANFGNLSDESTLDDGMNYIHDNIDATGTNYTLYCNTSVAVMAENNVWDFSDADSIAVTIIDHQDGSGTGSVDFDPFIVHVAPTFTQTPATDAIVGLAYNSTVAATSVLGRNIEFAMTVGPTWLTLTDNGDNTATIAGAPTETGDFDITITANDHVMPIGMLQYTLHVTAQNHAPNFTITDAPVEGTIGTMYQAHFTAEDTDGDALLFSMLEGPDWMSLVDNNNGTAVLTGIPTIVNDDTVTIAVNDGFNPAVTYSYQLSIGPVGTDDNLATPGHPVIYPNPFRNTVGIHFAMKTPGLAKVKVYNLRGQRVTTLTNAVAASGEHTLLWNGKNDAQQRVAEGVYFVRIEANGTVVTKPITLLQR